MTPPSLRLLRRQISLLDGGMRRLLRLRQRLVGAVGRRKRALGWPLQDPGREAEMRREAERDARSLGLADSAATELLNLSIERCRADLGGTATRAEAERPAGLVAALRWLPPPPRWAPLLRILPHGPLRQGSRQLFRAALASALAEGELEPLRGRRLAIEASDLGLRWVVEVGDRQIDVLDPATPAEASIRGGAVDLLQLASRSADADSLFFQRRLQLTGDVELGLTARNLLDRLPWEGVPLALRILLQRAARLAEAARDAHRAARGTDPGSAALAAPVQASVARG